MPLSGSKRAAAILLFAFKCSCPVTSDLATPPSNGLPDCVIFSRFVFEALSVVDATQICLRPLISLNPCSTCSSVHEQRSRTLKTQWAE